MTHAHRGEETDIYVGAVDFREDRWRPIEEILILGESAPRQTSPGQKNDGNGFLAYASCNPSPRSAAARTLR